MSFLLAEGVRRWSYGPVAASLQIVSQVLLDARLDVAHHERRDLAGESLDQLGVLAGELRAHLVRNLRQRPVALVVALPDQPLAEELLVEHPLVLAAQEALLAA